jgi:hypothetical protein
MCVEITRRVKKPTKRVVTVWKVVSCIERDFWASWLYYLWFERGEWVKAEHPDYGFNCFTRRRDADSIVDSPSAVVKCRARLIEGYGTFGGRPVVFAREIFVPRSKKEVVE